MSNKQLYRQCRMEKEIETGKLIHVAWIPTQYAKKDKVISTSGKFVKIKNEIKLRQLLIMK